jgi:hypothetical protein
MGTIFKWFIVIGTTLSLGFLSFAGVFLVNTAWLGISKFILGVAAFGFAVIIEGLVYSICINRGWNRWSNSGEDYLRAVIATDILTQHIQRLRDNASPEAKQYIADKKSLEEVDHAVGELEPVDWILEPRKRWKLSQQKKILKEKVKEAETNLIAEHDQPSSIFHDSIENEVKKRSSTNGVRLIRALAALSGMSTFFAVLAAAQASFPYLPILLSSTAMWAICLPITIFAAIGTFWLVSDSLMELMQEGTLSKENLSKWWSKPKKASFFLYLVLFGIAGLVTASVFWTWLADGKTSAMGIVHSLSIGFLSPLSVGWIIGILAVATLLTTFIWNASKMLTALKLFKSKIAKIPEHIQTFFKDLKATFLKEKAEGNLHHFFNPLRWLNNLIKFLLRAVVLLVHGISIGLTANKLGAIPPSVNTIFDGSVEILTDIACIEHGQSDVPTEEEKIADNQKSDEPYEVKKLPEGEHSHSDLTGLLLIPPIVLALKSAEFLVVLVLTLLGSLFCLFEKSFWESICCSFEKIFSNVNVKEFNYPTTSDPANKLDFTAGSIEIPKGADTSFCPAPSANKIISERDQNEILDLIGMSNAQMKMFQPQQSR